MKRVLVLWSGGLDSTCLIHRLLKEGHHVEARYVEILNNVAKTKNELEAIRRLSKDPLLKSFGQNFRFKDDEHNKVFVIVNNRPHITQFLLFLDHLSMLANPNEFDEVSLGIVLGDDAPSFMAEIQDYWSSRSRLFVDGLPKLTFPIMKEHKLDLYRELSPFSQKRVWWCEDVDSAYPKQCGDKCHPCRKASFLGIVPGKK